MRRLGLLSVLLAGSALAADVETAIRSTFVQPWVEALRSNDPAKLSQFRHPKVQACLNDQTREYFEFNRSDRLAGVKGAYHITKLVPWNGPGPLWTLPADGFAYPVQPAYELNLQFEGSNTTVIRYLAPSGESWYLVEPCPNEKGMAFFREQVAKGKEQKKRVAELVAGLKDPLLSELKSLLEHHRMRDAVKKYQEATGLADFTLAVMVIDAIDPGHPLSKR